MENQEIKQEVINRKGNKYLQAILDIIKMGGFSDEFLALAVSKLLKEGLIPFTVFPKTNKERK